MGLDEVRREIDLVDMQMKELFLKRMKLSGQVIAAKKQTGGAVYVPQREVEIIEKRSEGIDEDKLPEYQTFIKQVMNISRTYQYSKIADDAQEIAKLPEGTGTITLRVFSRKGSMQLFFVLDAFVLAGLMPEDLEVSEQTQEGTVYQIRLVGDFGKALAKGAILQSFRELEQVQFI